MYKLEFLPIAKNDIDSIIYYISNNLKNVTASRKLRDLFIDGIDKILEFPYGFPIYQKVKFLKNEYRSFKVKNFIMFYTINEHDKIITIVRILYQKMDISKILES